MSQVQSGGKSVLETKGILRCRDWEILSCLISLTIRPISRNISSLSSHTLYPFKVVVFLGWR